MAELAIDTVTYRFAKPWKREVRHYEVEIEAEVEGCSRKPEGFIRDLVDKFRSSLREWGHVKLLTGFAVEELMGKGELGDLIDGRNNLKAGAYERISAPSGPAGCGHAEARAGEGREGLM